MARQRILIFNIDKEGYYLEWKNRIYRCSLKLNTQITLSEEQIKKFIKSKFY
jgi:hypothetical protein